MILLNMLVFLMCFSMCDLYELGRCIFDKEMKLNTPGEAFYNVPSLENDT